MACLFVRASRLAGLGTAAVLIFTSFAAAAASDPAQVIESFQSGLLGVWKQARTLSPEERFRRLDPLVRQVFDLEQMIQTATGTAWRNASSSERTALVNAFTRMSVSNYVARFDSYSGQSFEIAGERPGPSSLRNVDIRIVTGSGKSVDLTYVMTGTGSGWRAIDVLLDGSISEMAVRRSEYRRILKQGGISELTLELERLADKLMAEAR
jgi:phospholipid transport system substrate-binding protein